MAKENDQDDEDDYLWSLLFDSDDEEEDFGTKRLLPIILAARKYLDEKESTGTYYVRDRLEWDFHVSSLLKEGTDSFRKMYRMEYESFTNLCTILHPYLSVDEHMSTVRTSKSPITTEIICIV
jgi:hypothetical protein